MTCRLSLPEKEEESPDSKEQRTLRQAGDWFLQGIKTESATENDRLPLWGWVRVKM